MNNLNLGLNYDPKQKPKPDASIHINPNTSPNTNPNASPNASSNASSNVSSNVSPIANPSAPFDLSPDLTLNRAALPEPGVSFGYYAFEIISDIVLGVILGVLLNAFVDYLGQILNMPFYAIIILQVFLIIVVLYYLKVDSIHLYAAWRGQAGYGIIFTSVFLAVQKNIIIFFEKIYPFEK